MHKLNLFINYEKHIKLLINSKISKQNVSTKMKNNYVLLILTQLLILISSFGYGQDAQFAGVGSAEKALTTSNAYELLGKGLCYQENFTYGLDLNPDYSHFRAIAQKGFRHLRIAVNYLEIGGALDEYPYEFNTEFTKVLTTTVDSALAQGLYVILCGPDDQRIMDNPETYKFILYRFWEQINDLFINYDDHLIFEFSNEPRGEGLTSETWNEMIVDLFNIIRPDHPERFVVLQPFQYANITEILNLKIPQQELEKSLVAFHFYEPFTLTHQHTFPSLKQTIFGKNYLEIESIYSRIKWYRELADSLGFTLWSGESGIDKYIGETSRNNWAQAVSYACSKYNIPHAYFDFGSGMGVFNTETNEWNDNLCNSILDPQEVKSFTYNHNTVYYTDFNTDMNEFVFYHYDNSVQVEHFLKGGNLVVIPDANNTDNEYSFAIGAENLNMEKGKYYALSFKAKTCGNPAPLHYAFGSSWNAMVFTKSWNTFITVPRAAEDFQNYGFTIPLGCITDTLWIDEMGIFEIDQTYASGIVSNHENEINQLYGSTELSYSITPDDAIEQSYNLEIVSGTDIADFSENTKLCAIGHKSGEVVIKVQARDDSQVDYIDRVYVSNQNSLVRDGNFNFNETYWSKNQQLDGVFQVINHQFIADPQNIGNSYDLNLWSSFRLNETGVYRLKFRMTSEINRSVEIDLGNTDNNSNTAFWSVDLKEGTNSITLYSDIAQSDLGNSILQFMFGHELGRVVVEHVSLTKIDNPVNVTFKVDMQNETVSNSGVFLLSSFNNWYSDVSLEQDGTIYSTTVSMVAGDSIEYKFANGNQWEEDISSICANSSSNRYIKVPSQDSILNVVCFNSCESCNTTASYTQDSKEEISLRPNPTSGYVIVTNLPSDKKLTIRVFDLNNRQIKELCSNCRSSILVDLSDLIDGMYFINFLGNEYNKTLKVIKE